MSVMHIAQRWHGACHLQGRLKYPIQIFLKKFIIKIQELWKIQKKHWSEQ